MNPQISGAIGGTLATVPMTLAMMALFRCLPRDDQYPLPPREIADEVTRRAGQQPRLNDRRQAALSLTAHFAYGGITGALYPLVLRPLPFDAAVKQHIGYQCLFGCGYGVAIWAGSYLGWLPALRILGPATVQPAPRRRLMIGVHLIWGAGTVILGEALARKGHQAMD